jgi:hypothetical protein
MLLPAGRPNTNAPSALLSPLDTSASVALRLDNERHVAEALGDLLVAARKKDARSWVSSSEPATRWYFLTSGKAEIAPPPSIHAEFTQHPLISYVI